MSEEESLAFGVNNLTSTCLSTCQFRGHLSFAIHDDSGQTPHEMGSTNSFNYSTCRCTRVLHENISWLAPEEIRGLQERLHCLTDFHLPFFPPSFLLSSSSSTTSACLASSLSSRSQPSSTRARFAGVRRGDQGCRQASRPPGGLDPLREGVCLRGRMEDVERPSRCSNLV